MLCLGKGLLFLRGCGRVRRMDCYCCNEQGGISIFKCRFRDTVAADDVIRLVVKKKELAERQESNLPDTDGL